MPTQTELAFFIIYYICKVMTREQIVKEINSKKSFLAVGLDSDLDRIPKHLLETEDPVFEFNKAIIDATKDYCISYKLNTAFYESNGIAGMISLQKTIEYIPENIFIIADAKRGDIGNTSKQYAKAFFETFACDAITVAPYMGSDSVQPFLEYKDKWTIVLGLTSNVGARDFQLQDLDNGQFLYENVIKTCATWGTADNMMFVTGATQAMELTNIRKILPNHFLLIPGVGTQGGNLQDVYKFGKNTQVGLIVNVSRDIIFADETEKFAEAAKNQAMNYQKEMQTLLDNK
jgi:orotidine-5'-phosphate decarboxylase